MWFRGLLIAAAVATAIEAPPPATAAPQSDTITVGSDVHIVWDGRDSAGRPVPKGRYQWTLTGSDAAGPVLWYTGSGARIGATVEVR